jgi:hypothetical protein
MFLWVNRLDMEGITLHTTVVGMATILPLHILEVCQVEEPQMYELEVQHYPIVKSLLVAVVVLVLIIMGIVTLTTAVLVVIQRGGMVRVVDGILVPIVGKGGHKPMVVPEHQVIRREPWAMAVETDFEAAAAAAVITVVVQGITAVAAAVDQIMRFRKQPMSHIHKGFNQEMVK